MCHARHAVTTGHIERVTVGDIVIHHLRRWGGGEGGGEGGGRRGGGEGRRRERGNELCVVAKYSWFFYLLMR